MTYKLAIIGCMLVSGCVSGMPTEKDTDTIRISVDAPAKVSFERRLAAAQTVAAQEQKQAQWIVEKAVSTSRTSFTFVCW